jgi:hypothetical protein
MPPKEAQVILHTNNAIDKNRDSYSKKRSYLTPILVKYGHLSIITAAGTGTIAEINPGQGSKIHRS